MNRSRTNSRLSESKPWVRVQVCCAGAQARKFAAPPLAHPLAHPDVHYYLCIFQANFLNNLPLCVHIFTYKADFGAKVGVKNEEVKMNEPVNG